MQSVAYRGTDPGPVFRNLAVCILQYAHLHNLLFSEYNGRLFSSRWLQLVATPVKYNYNSIENTSTLSARNITSKLDVGLSHTHVAREKSERNGKDCFAGGIHIRYDI